jgi:rSAM/selenodomain-associated transferase 1
METSTNTILLFTRYPQPGKCKTRLFSKLSTEEAAGIHRQLVCHSDNTINSYLTHFSDTTYHIHYTGASLKEMKHWLGDRRFTNQKGKDLGERMANALHTAILTGDKCLLMGSDCPDISWKLLQNAFIALQEKDIVLGPAHDGGYYLIGINKTLSPKHLKKLFTDIPWGSENVLHKTTERIEELQLSFQLLEKLHDIDTPDDLQYFNHHSHTE